MNCAAERWRVPPIVPDARRRRGAFDRLGLTTCSTAATFPARDLRAKSEQLITIREHHRAIDRGQPGDRLDASATAADFHGGPWPGRVRQTAARLHTGPAARSIPATSRFPRGPRAATRRVHGRAWRPRVAPSYSPNEPRMPANRTRAAPSAAAGSPAGRTPLVHHLDLIALEHRNVDELTILVAAVVLDHQQDRAPRPRARSTGPEWCVVVPQTLKSPLSRQTPRCTPGLSTAGATASARPDQGEWAARE